MKRIRKESEKAKEPLLLLNLGVEDDLLLLLTVLEELEANVDNVLGLWSQSSE